MESDSPTEVPNSKCQAEQEPMEENCNDSGINFGSDYHYSSPGSDSIMDCNPAESTSPTPLSTDCSTPASTPIDRKSNHHAAEGFNPPTPPSSESTSSPQCITIESDGESSTNLTPRNSPKLNSRGKTKKPSKCKHCDYIGNTKSEIWDHSRTHINADKLLTCTECPFVTEHKHHLVYHLNNHAGTKPYKCDQCEYSCINKSMLNSHMKSHSSVYQYGCADCHYHTKYLHALKQHLRKHNHKLSTVLNPDGTPKPLSIIDVHGKRRGPRQKSQPKELETAMPNPFEQFMMNSPQFPLRMAYASVGGLPNPLANQMLFAQYVQLSHLMNQHQNDKQEESSAAFDLNKIQPTCSETPVRTRRPRKGKAYRLKVNIESEQETIEEPYTNIFEPEVTITELATEITPTTVTPEPLNSKRNFICKYCNIAYGDAAIYNMHMGYHGQENPFTCNLCGENCTEKIAFYSHIINIAHTS